MKVFIATKNQKKLVELSRILEPMGFCVVCERDLDKPLEEIEETGTTFAENAMLKARVVASMCDYPVIADDSGLCVDALDGAPGIYSARFAGEDADDAERNRHLLELMEGKENRKAHYVAAIAYIGMDGMEYVTEGRTEGEIQLAEEGMGGFGYDPLFFSTEIGKCFGLATPDEKNEVSHRGRALRKLYEILVNEE